MSKVQRQQTIARLIGQSQVTNQPQLVELLAGEGIKATQATVSRDLEDLGAVKVRVPGGGDASTPSRSTSPTRIAPEDQLRRVMAEWVAEVRTRATWWSLRTPPGCAHVVASALDRRGLRGPARHRGRRRHHAVRRRRGGGRRSELARHGCATWPDIESNGARPAADGGDAVARTVRGRPGRGAAGLHGQPAVRPAAVARRHRRLAGPRPRAGARRAARRGRARPRSSAALDAGARPSWPRARSPSSPTDEDIHTAVERRVTELAGAGRGQAAHRPQPQRPGGHRPAAVVQAASWPAWRRRDRRPAGACCSQRADAAGDAYLPGYTHLQRAQPVLLAHHLLAHGWALGRDVDRLLATRRRASTCRRSAPARWPVRRCRSTRRATAAELGFAARLRQQPRRRQRPRLRRRGAVRPGPDRRPPVAASARSGCCGRARSSASPASTTPTPPARRCCRRRRTPTSPSSARGKAGTADRQPDRPAGDAQGPAAGLQPRPAGGQGAAVRLGRSGDAGRSPP